MPKQKVFVSWSKEGSASDKLAQVFHEWLPIVINQVKPWLSNKDLEMGTRWNSVITGELARSQFGIFCVTPVSQHSPWMLFEAGAISKEAQSRAYVYLLGLKRHEVIAPWNQFQMAEPNEGDTRLLIESLNQSLGEDKLEPPLLEKSFNRSWHELQRALDEIVAFGETKDGTGTGPRPEAAQINTLIERIFNICLEQSKQGASIVTELESLKRDVLRIGRFGLPKVQTQPGSEPTEEQTDWPFSSLARALDARGIPYLKIFNIKGAYVVEIDDRSLQIPDEVAEWIMNRSVADREVGYVWESLKVGARVTRPSEPASGPRP